MGDVYEVMPFDNQIATVTLTGAQVLDLLEHGISGGSVVQLSGLSVVYDSDRPKGERVLAVRLPNGKRLDPGGRYKVATNDFMAQGGDGFTMIAQGEGLTMPGLLMRDLLIADVEKHGKSGVPLAAPKPGRVVNQSAKANAPQTSDASR
jgi:2',3'-cyclic-nucleotide 2'-phosphodiesterase (5'-nucleotidase family)